MSYRDEMIPALKALLASAAPPSMIFIDVSLVDDRSTMRLVRKCERAGHLFVWGRGTRFLGPLSDTGATH